MSGIFSRANLKTRKSLNKRGGNFWDIYLNNALEAVVRRCFVKPSFRPATLLKKSLAQVFPMNFAKFLRKLFFTENFRWSLLMLLTSWVKFADPFFMSKKQRYVGLNFLYDTWVPMDKINEYNRAVNQEKCCKCFDMYSRIHVQSCISLNVQSMS